MKCSCDGHPLCQVLPFVQRACDAETTIEILYIHQMNGSNQTERMTPVKISGTVINVLTKSITGICEAAASMNQET